MIGGKSFAELEDDSLARLADKDPRIKIRALEPRRRTYHSMIDSSKTLGSCPLYDRKVMKLMTGHPVTCILLVMYYMTSWVQVMQYMTSQIQVMYFMTS